MYYLIKHPTCRDETVMIQVPPKTQQGRWKTVHIKVDSEGVAGVSPTVWETEIRVAQDAGLTSEQFLIIGERQEKGPAQTVSRTNKSPETKVGEMETPQGRKTINFRQFQELMAEAKADNFRTGVNRMTERSKGWT